MQLMLLLVTATATGNVRPLFSPPQPPPIVQGNMPTFTEVDLNVRDYMLFDMGVTDLNGDGFLDIFSVNHNAVQSFLLNDGKGHFTETYDAWCRATPLAQDAAFPGIEDRATPPAKVDALQLYWMDRHFVLQNNTATTMTCSVAFLSNVEIEHNEHASATVHTLAEAAGPDNPSPQPTRVNIVLESGGNTHIRPRLLAADVRVMLDAAIPLQQCAVGAGLMTPPDHTFTLSLRDRHGLAVADINNDSLPDIAITRGGLKGNIQSVPGEFFHELFLSSGEPGMFSPAHEQLPVDDHRARSAAWIDIDGDDVAELFITGLGSDAQLFRRDADAGAFIECAAAHGLSEIRNGLPVWFDVDLDDDLDCIVATPTGILLARNFDGHFLVTNIHPPLATAATIVRQGHAGRPTVGDVDHDGDVDIYFASLGGSVLLINDAGLFRAVDPAILQLPTAAATANWVDMNMDGLLDLHTAPGELFLQTANGTFFATGLLKTTMNQNLRESRINFFDADDDGDRDVLMTSISIDDEAAASNATSFLLTHAPDDNTRRWLTIDVHLRSGAPAGSTIFVERLNGDVTAFAVGGSEGSHFSQGHMRTYVGLGSDEAVRSVTLRTPSGRVVTMTDVAADQHIILNEPSR